ncbi:hypothetical protein GGTG_00988 [Gaeumannomyces tritici R3-111a-1]|uniref:Uncharacterized protein n=1 Tax=Gaeumannomyces tritici (strain R3-111a-1) TaxID=644352 RepID=J3NIA5_GAET3|nr:hypothetical protein GGTG_00988 [Gaeumannomyces tritici R3-111a-1]EJT80998.1 hypothetical protein GGTG_00988 [Gaeumannomyces tritici R3-111a-1]
MFKYKTYLFKKVKNARTFWLGIKLHCGARAIRKGRLLQEALGSSGSRMGQLYLP